MLRDDQIAEQIEEVLEQLQPYFLMHGGRITFLSYQSGTVTVKLSGACGGCPSSEITLKSLVETELRKEVPQVTTVVAVEE